MNQHLDKEKTRKALLTDEEKRANALKSGAKELKLSGKDFNAIDRLQPTVGRRHFMVRDTYFEVR